MRLQDAVEPPRQELFRRLNMAPGGTAALVEMRRLLLKALKANPQWRAIDADLLHLLRSWFNRGFLRLERIDWRTSAIVLEKLIAVRGGARDRRAGATCAAGCEADRRCFAFFHPQLPDEPIIFIEVALTRGMSAQRAAAARHARAGRAARAAPTARCSTRSPTARKACAASRSATC